MENGNKINVWWLFISGSVLISAGWFMKPFPIFIFVGLAPFFAILDHTIESDNFWENAELTLLGMFVYFFSAYNLESANLIKVILLAILFTLPFLGFAFVYESLGPRTGKFIIIFFWLAIEYTILSLAWPKQPVYLADAFLNTTTWYKWNTESGYLGVSAWVLFTNWILYSGTLRGNLNWYLITLGLALIIGPIVFSEFQGGKPILRSEMIELYRHHDVSNSVYKTKGELVARTCAWLSPLILLFAIVKSRISK
jgi:hypothetical protein